MPFSFVQTLRKKITRPCFETTQINTPQLFLRPPQSGDCQSWVALRNESRDFLVPWEPSWPDRIILEKDFRSMLKIRRKKWLNDNSYSFFLFRKDDGALAGAINLNNLVRGAGQYTTLGYWVGEKFTGKGYMTEAVAAATDFAFDDLKLHKVIAATLPDNIASRRVLQKLGFTKEGMVRKHLKIAGQWRDHILYSLLDSDPRP
ncbi:MAG: N-acetyltransferase [Micavibrio sp.]|nr:MAG: N-acetyltransferase [Micavibrio sp.]